MGELVTGWKEDRGTQFRRCIRQTLQVILFCCCFCFTFGERPKHQSAYIRSSQPRLFILDRATTGWISPFRLRLRGARQVTRRIYYRRVKLHCILRNAKLCWYNALYRRTTSIGNGSEIRVPSRGRMIAFAQRSCEYSGWIVYIRLWSSFLHKTIYSAPSCLCLALAQNFVHQLDHRVALSSLIPSHMYYILCLGGLKSRNASTANQNNVIPCLKEYFQVKRKKKTWKNRGG